MIRRLRYWVRRRLRWCGIAGALAFGCAGAAPAVVTCSPRADAWFAATLTEKCRGVPLADCGIAAAIGDEYERRAEAECTRP